MEEWLQWSQQVLFGAHATLFLSMFFIPFLFAEKCFSPRLKLGIVPLRAAPLHSESVFAKHLPRWRQPCLSRAVAFALQDFHKLETASPSSFSQLYSLPLLFESFLECHVLTGHFGHA